MNQITVHLLLLLFQNKW